MALINCPNCGNRISDKAVKCPRCGYVLPRPSVEEIKATDVKAETTKPNAEETTPKPSKPNRMTWLLAVIFAVVVVGIGVGGYVWYDNNQKQIAIRLQHEQDSIAAVQRELARIDSLRQDSINSRNEFVASFVKITDLVGKDNSSYGQCFTWRSSLKEKETYEYFNTFLLNRGYNLINKSSDMVEVEGGDYDVMYIHTYKLESDRFPDLWNEVELTTGRWVCEHISVHFCDEAQANEFWKECQEFGFKKSPYYDSSTLIEPINDSCYSVDRKGNNITVWQGGL